MRLGHGRRLVHINKYSLHRSRVRLLFFAGCAVSEAPFVGPARGMRLAAATGDGGVLRPTPTRAGQTPKNERQTAATATALTSNSRTSRQRDRSLVDAGVAVAATVVVFLLCGACSHFRVSI